ncbi:hypothetical protein PsyrCH409_06290 [Pseudomonas viridiflava]|jgi:hypothetical protein|nr:MULTISPECIES: hypothetical protein [Pseudomonas]MBD0703850.1 hypothetical protein [Pseudomonas sp. PSB1]PBJ07226.1 hypothetical protein BSF43_34790 [Pseudomonas ogarae]PCK92898.1 hypothetical protein PsyrCH409_06290 [Pseudomonas viridiflava]
MSLLSDIQGSAERIWSLLRLLDANGGWMKRDEVPQWMNPQFTAESSVAPGPDATALSQTVGAAVSVGLIAATDGGYRLLLENVPLRFDGFADAVHQTLCQLPSGHADYVVLEAYAAIVILTEKYGGTHWIRERNNTELADTVLAQALRADSEEERRFNSTKLTPWVRWVTFMGLAMPQQARGALYPTITERLERELSVLVDTLSPVTEHVFADFLVSLGQRMPYIDGGALFIDLAQREGLRPMGRRLSRVLSNALRDLHDDGRIELIAVGDTAGMYELVGEAHPVRAVTSIRFTLGADNHA